MAVRFSCGCGEAGPSGCDNACGSTLENDECGVCGGDNTSCADCAGIPNGDTVEDCAGECGGSAQADACGVCNGDGSTCIYNPWQSPEQAIYQFSGASLDGNDLTSNDWIIAKNEESGILVGATQYTPVDYDSNGDPVYQLMIMGETLSDGNTPIDCNVTGTCGMMLPGQTPQFYVFYAGVGEIKAHYSAADGTVLQNIPTYNGLGLNTGLTLDLVTDCNDDMGGAAVDSGLCGDCWGGNTGNSEDYMDTDNDGVCNEGSANGEADNCPDTANTDQANNDGDDDGDLCDSDDDNDGCLDDVDDDQMTFDDDNDLDGTPDDCDDDDDNDGVDDTGDSHPEDNTQCSDTDGDTCEDCSSGSYNVSDDGWDYDGDGACDAGDDDDDNDGALDENDSHDNDEYQCSFDDADNCDDCSSGTYNTSDDGPDNEGDGLCDDGDPDDDNDGCDDGVDDNQMTWDDDYDGDGDDGDDDGGYDDGGGDDEYDDDDGDDDD